MKFKKLLIFLLFIPIYVLFVNYILRHRHLVESINQESSVKNGGSEISNSGQLITPQQDILIETIQLSSNEDEKNENSKRDEQDVIEGEVVLTFETIEDRIHFLNRSNNGEFEVLDVLSKFNSLRVRVNDTQNFNTILDDYADRVEYSPNYYVNTPDLVSDFPFEVRSNQTIPFGKHVLPLLGLHPDDSFTGKGALIAVLDTGVNENHPALAGKVREVIDLIQGEPEIEDETYSSHGTAVASLIVGDSPEVKGIASDAEILSIRVLDNNGEGDAFTLASGIVEAVDRGANPINLSLGTWGHSPVLKNAVEYALSHDVNIVAASGNDGLNEITYPARYEGVIAVTANDVLGQHPDFANIGYEVDVSAPGIGIPAAWGDEGIVSFSGTSAAAPFISAALASESSKNPELNANEALNVVLENTNDRGAPGADPVYGVGTLNVGDIQDRHIPGIFDASIGDHYIDVNYESEDHIRLLISAQNTGTERLSHMFLTVDIDGHQQEIEFFDVNVRETVSESILLEKSKLVDGGTINVKSRVNIGHEPDYDTNNNEKVSTVLSSPVSAE